MDEDQDLFEGAVTQKCRWLLSGARGGGMNWCLKKGPKAERLRFHKKRLEKQLEVEQGQNKPDETFLKEECMYSFDTVRRLGISCRTVKP